MNDQEIEKQVRGTFTSPGPARDAALSDVRAFAEYPETLQALLLEVSPEFLSSVAALLRALESGQQWARACDATATNPGQPQPEDFSATQATDDTDAWPNPPAGG
jgi:hypothetical protein